jgi:hypothetical protein
METKEELVNAIKEWVKLDNEIKKLQSELKSRKTRQQKVSELLMETMKKENIDGVDLNNGKDQLCYTKRSVKKPITKSFLLNILSKYYKEDATKALEVNTFIFENRDVIIKESIQMKKYKS